jgi:hypothetical protein
MARAAAVYFDDVVFDDGRFMAFGAGRRIVRFVTTHLMMALAALAAVGVCTVVATATAAWMVNSGMSRDGQMQGRGQAGNFGGPATLALGYGATAAAGLPAGSLRRAFGPTWTRSAGVRPQIVEVPQDRIKQDVASTGYFAPTAKLMPAAPAPEAAAFVAKPTAEWTIAAPVIPLPRRKAVHQDFANLTPANEPDVMPRARPDVVAVPRVARPAADMPPPAPATPVAVAPIQTKLADLPDAGHRVAVYDIAAHTVYLPDGQKLEAHSGYGDKLDDPRFVKVRMRGPTPPNVYDLSLRQALFHGVRAIRLTPLDESKMHGRDGMLAHTYMLGPSGASNGCVSFRDYRKFLTAFLDGKVDRLVVVPALGNTSWQSAARQGGVRTGPVRRYAANDAGNNNPPARGSILDRLSSVW